MNQGHREGDLGIKRLDQPLICAKLGREQRQLESCKDHRPSAMQFVPFRGRVHIVVLLLQQNSRKGGILTPVCTPEEHFVRSPRKVTTLSAINPSNCGAGIIGILHVDIFPGLSEVSQRKVHALLIHLLHHQHLYVSLPLTSHSLSVHYQPRSRVLPYCSSNDLND